MANMEELLAAAGTEDMDDELSYVIDEHLRVIAVPERGVVLGVEGDKDVNRVRFAINRYYHGSDFAKFAIRINYENAEGERNYFTVTEKTVEEDRMSFIWTVDADAVAYKGSVHFVVNCFTASEEGTVEKAYHTTLGSATVLEGLSVGKDTDSPEIVDLLTRLEHDLGTYVGTLIVQAENAAKNSDESRIAAANSVAAAKASAISAGSSASKASSSETAAKTSETNASTSETAAKTSETNASASASKAASSATTAKTSETNAASSASGAASAASTATAQASIATSKASAAASSASAAAASQTAAGNSATAAKTSESNAATSATAAKASAEAAAKSAKDAAAAANTDTTLSISGAPADAKAVGDAFKNVYGKTETYTKAEADAKFGTLYTLPPATVSTLGGVKVGDYLDIAADGTLSGKTLYDTIAASVAVKSEARLVSNTHERSPEKFKTWDVQIPDNVDKICITRGLCSNHDNNTEKSIARGGTITYECNYSFTITFQANGILHVTNSYSVSFHLDLWIDGYHYPTLADLLTETQAAQADTDALAVDQEYRIAMLELGLTDDPTTDTTT